MVIIVLNVINLIGDPILIFVLDWGLVGAAAATTFSQWTGALIFVWLLLGRRREEFGIEIELPSPAELVPFLRIGGHLFIRTGALVGTMTMATAVAARVGVTAVAAHQVANQLWGFLALVVDALAVAAQALVSKHLGSGRPDEARSVSNRLLQLGIGAGVVLAVGVWLLRPYLPLVFSDDPETIRQVVDIFIFVALLQPLNGLVFVWDGVFMGAEDFLYLAVAMVISAAAAAGVLLAVLPMGWGLHGVWWGITTLMLVRILTLGWRYLRKPELGV